MPGLQRGEPLMTPARGNEKLHCPARPAAGKPVADVCFALAVILKLLQISFALPAAFALFFAKACSLSPAVQRAHHAVNDKQNLS